MMAKSFPRLCRAGVLAGLGALVLPACGPAPAPAAPTAAPAAPPLASGQPAAPPSYHRDRDPMSASYDGEKNPFTRLIVARMWLAVARVDAGEGGQREQTALASVKRAEEQTAAIAEPCERRARAALDWAEATKQALERRYLSSVDLLGEQNVGTREVDAQVTVLRDEIDVLERRMQSCPKQYFGPGDR
jgi:hypothetical protein